MQKVDIYVKSIKCLSLRVGNYFSGGCIPYIRTILFNYTFTCIKIISIIALVFTFCIIVLIKLYKTILIYIDLFLFSVIDKSVRR